MKTETYNGWSNYPTWNAALWLGNEEGSSRYCDETAQEAYNDAKADDTFTRIENAAFVLSEQIKALFESDECLPESGWMADAVNSYLGAVNWHESAESYFENVGRKEEEEA
jgi:hypothetical protein